MHCLLILLALLAPFLVTCLVPRNPNARNVNPVFSFLSDARDPLQTTPAHRRRRRSNSSRDRRLAGRVDIGVPCQDKSILPFSFELGEAFSDKACGDSNLILNGIPFPQSWHTNSQGHYEGSASSLVNVVKDDSLHVAAIDSTTTCRSEVDEDTSEDVIVSTIVLNVNHFDQSVLKDTGFVVTFDQQKQNIRSIQTLSEYQSHALESSQGDQNEEEISTADVALQDSPTEYHELLIDDQDISEASSAEDHSTTAPATSLIEQFQRLQYLEKDLKELKQLFNAQRRIVQDLYKDSHRKTYQGFKQCSDVSCYFSTFLHGAKGCLKIIHLRMNSPSGNKPDFASWQDTRQSYMGTGTCEGQKDPAQNDKQVVTAGVKQPEIHDQPTSYLHLPESEDEEVLAYEVLGGLACLLCLGSVAYCFKRRCCNPRARAERASRREERRTRRQYKCLARKKAWSDWWDRRLHRNSRGSSSDYEEKRVLILSQEAVLENAQQEEVRHLRQMHSGGRNEARLAEEGQIRRVAIGMAGDDDTLPEYRSRAGSGRPPSYISQAPSEMAVVVGGVVLTPPPTCSTPSTDITPDSSVANLSPRHSFETLRTELSII